jgi:hypothetical protein
MRQAPRSHRRAKASRERRQRIERAQTKDRLSKTLAAALAMPNTAATESASSESFQTTNGKDLQLGGHRAIAEWSNGRAHPARPAGKTLCASQSSYPLQSGYRERNRQCENPRMKEMIGRPERVRTGADMLSEECLVLKPPNHLTWSAAIGCTPFLE